MPKFDIVQQAMTAYCRWRDSPDGSEAKKASYKEVCAASRAMLLEIGEVFPAGHLSLGLDSIDIYTCDNVSIEDMMVLSEFFSSQEIDIISPKNADEGCDQQWVDQVGYPPWIKIVVRLPPLREQGEWRVESGERRGPMTNYAVVSVMMVRGTNHATVSWFDSREAALVHKEWQERKAIIGKVDMVHFILPYYGDEVVAMDAAFNKALREQERNG